VLSPKSRLFPESRLPLSRIYFLERPHLPYYPTGILARPPAVISALLLTAPIANTRLPALAAQ